jgi:CheY-like chemotaxis protein
MDAMSRDNNYTILILEDDPNDILLLKRALEKNEIRNPLQVVPDGIEGIAYLQGTGKYGDRAKHPFPKVIIMDLKMPRLGGLEVLEFLKRHAEFSVIPTLVLSSSSELTDVAKAYQFGANSYMVKPTNFDDLQALIKLVHEYWTRAVKPQPRT